ncbi:MAG TPA: dolichyl-phosphate beta-glucosyltransferase [Thermoanaerobaculia bacterium]|jgi:dolichyl-phosphate beta-glucosyltransferase|nr:dolichyl-phosphate beta-glucosyltransferase [Thermoanaerobaculia bacterium]
MDLSIVIPAYNEAARLGPTLERILGYLAGQKIAAEILVVDDGSTDRTAAVAESFAGRGVVLYRQDRNRGKGAALRSGVVASRGATVLLVDADLSTPIEDLERLRPYLAGAELVLGSRSVPGANVTQHQPIYREIMGRTFNLLIRTVGVRGFRDTQCGFKLLDGEAARQLFADLSVDRFAYDVELVWLARRRGYRIAEVGVTWANSPYSSVDPLKDSARMIWDIVVMRFRHRGRK